MFNNEKIYFKKMCILGTLTYGNLESKGHLDARMKLEFCQVSDPRRIQCLCPKTSILTNAFLA